MNIDHMIMIAGWAHSTTDLEPLCAGLSSRFNIQPTSTAQLLASAPPQEPGTPMASGYAKALAAMVSKTTGPTAVIAWSMGALAALEAISHLGSAPAALILVSGTPRFCATDHYACGLPEKNLRSLASSLSKRPEDTLISFFRDAMFPETDVAGTIGLRARTAMSSSLDVLRDGLSYLRNIDVRDDLQHIRMPALLLHGAADRIIPPAAGEFMSRRLPSAQLNIYRDAGHSMIRTHAKDVSESIRIFLENTP